MSLGERNQYSINDRYVEDAGRVFLTGVQALARLPIQQLRADRRRGLNTAALLAGYPGSPLAGLNFEIENAKQLVPDLPIVHRPLLNEEHGATAVMGSQLAAEQPDCEFDGIAGFWYGKAPGLDRAGDALRHAVFTGTSRLGGAVAIVGDDPAAKSSTLPSSSDATLFDLHMPILYPGDVEEILTLGMHAISLSRITGAWTALKIVDAVADGSGTLDLGATVIEPVVPDLEIEGVKYEHHPDAKLLPPNNLALERDLRVVRSELVRRYTVANKLNPVIVNPHDAWIGLIASGFTYHELRNALYSIGLRTLDDIANAGIRLLHLQLPVPFDPQNIRNFSEGLDEILVIEEKNPTAEWLVKDALYGSANQPRVLGKTRPDGQPLMPSHGILDADAIVQGLFDRLSLRVRDRLVEPRKKNKQRELIPLDVTRSPYFCSGCPHNSSTKVPEDSLIGAGIGCHTMVLLMDDDQVGNIAGVTAMGNEGMQWVGMEPFVERKHFIQNIGDGTYFHSGQLAIASAVAANSNITFKLLYNGTIAMTGGQDPKGGLGVIEITQIMLAQGVEQIIITTEDPSRYKETDFPKEVSVWTRERIIEAQESLAEVSGVTVLIHDQACAAQLRRTRKRGQSEKPDFRVLINNRICEACGDCGTVSNCLSVQTQQTEFGPKAYIDQDSCNFDASCLKGDCPSFISVETSPDEQEKIPANDDWVFQDIPAPKQKISNDSVDIRMAGIGGTGVVTAAQILATAAMLSDFEVRGLDQTGLSQKAGPVISDIRLTRSSPRPSNLLMKQSADLILGFDLLVAVSDRTLEVLRPGHTIIVASDSETPTGSMVGHPYASFPDAKQLIDRAAGLTNEESNFLVDAKLICTQLLGSSTSSNIFLLGVATQIGVLPIDPKSFEEAIALNGVAVEANMTAFNWGRVWANDPEEIKKRVNTKVALSEKSNQVQLPDSITSSIESLNVNAEISDLLRLLCSEIIKFQNAKLAHFYLEIIEEAVKSSTRINDQGKSDKLIQSIVKNVYKLIAYKDEYEVARLFLSPEIADQVKNLPQSTGKATWHFQPPFLRSMGLKRKLKLPFALAIPIMKILSRGKFLRGTRFDPFGYAEVRKVERLIRDRYIEEILGALQNLSTDSYPQILQMSNLPESVRGFESLKLKSADEFLKRLNEVSEAIK